MKVCNKCKEAKPAEAFYKKLSNKDGLDGRCKKCMAEYHSARYIERKGSVQTPIEKLCIGCSKVRLSDSFPSQGVSPDGLSARCRECWQHYNRQRLYGITETDYATMMKRQNGLCGICKENEAVVVDHNHDTSFVRGLLCHNCNRGIGLLGDDAKRLRAAAEYLEEN